MKENIIKALDHLNQIKLTQVNSDDAWFWISRATEQLLKALSENK